MPCNPLTDLTGCLGPAAGGQTNAVGAQGWNAICQSFGNAAQQLLGSFAKSFVAIPPVNLSYAGVRSVYGLSLEIAALIAAVLLMIQVIRTVMVHDGSAIAQGLVGVGKATLAFVLTLGAAATALRASDELTRWIIARTFGSPAVLSARLAHLANFDPQVSPSLLLIMALLGILLTIALWGQLLVRNIAVTVLVAVSPVAAAGQVAHATQQWWRRLVRAAVQLIALKPVVALVFAVGLTMPGTAGGVQKLLAGMLVLLLAGCAWPAMARLSAVLEVYVGGGALAGIRGGAGVRGAGGPPGGVAPAELSRVAEVRTMAAIHDYHSRSAEAALRAAPGLGRLADLARAGISAGTPASHELAALAAPTHGAPTHGAANHGAAVAGGTSSTPDDGAGPLPGPDTGHGPSSHSPANHSPANHGAAPGAWRSR